MGVKRWSIRDPHSLVSGLASLLTTKFSQGVKKQELGRNGHRKGPAQEPFSETD